MNRATSHNTLLERLVALSDSIRLRLLRVLEREEFSVGELAKVLQLPQSTVSRHLKVLADLPGGRHRSGGWLQRRSEGTATLYRLVLDDLDTEARALWVAVRDQMHSESPEVSEDARRMVAVLAERRTDTQAFFGRVAGEWDTVRDELFGGTFAFHAVLSLLPAHWTVADLGCGTGNISELLAPVVKRVVAIDQSEPMLAAACKRLAGATNVEFVRGDLLALPLDDCSVDAAVSALVMHHLPDPGAAIREMARVIRPGGVALIIDMVSHNRDSYRHTMGHRWLGFDAPAISEMMANAGLVQSRVRVLPSETAAKGPGLFAATAHKPPPP